MNHFLKADLIHNGHSFIKENVLVLKADGEIVDLVMSDTLDDSKVEKIEGILCPGFVNAHCHTELSAMKGMIPEQTGLVNFVNGVLQNRDQLVDVESSIAIAEAIEQMEAVGIVAVGDICNTLNSMEAKKHSSIFFHNFIEVSGFPPAIADEKFQAIEDLRNAADALNLAHNINTVTPHAPYSTSPELIEKCVAANPQLISIHNQEAQSENNLFLYKDGQMLKLYENLNVDLDFFQKTNKTSLASTLPYLKNSQHTIFVHNTFTNEGDLDDILNTWDEEFSICLCPNANLYIENTLPDCNIFFQRVPEMVCLGTDSLASNKQLSIMAEISTLLDSYSSIDMEYALTMATYNGAKALRIEDQFGSFVEGKNPGVLQVRNEKEVERLY